MALLTLDSAPPSKLKRSVTAGLSGLSAVIVAAMALHAVSFLGLFPDGSLLSGASFLPVSWLLPLIVLVVVGDLIARRRRLAVAVAGTYAALALLAGDYSLHAVATVAPEGARRLSVVALNVRYYSFGKEKVLGALQQINADVALLSENVLTPEEAEQLRQAALPADFRSGRSGETAILSRLPILEYHEVDLPSLQASLHGPSTLELRGDEPPRSFAHAIVDVDGVPVNVLSLRLIAGRAPAGDPLSQLRWGAYLLRVQAKEVAYFEQYLKTLQGPVVFGGDFNATPPSFPLRRLGALAEDSYLATHRMGWPTFRVSAPLMRLDYLFASPGLIPLRAERLDHVVSDHFPVFAEYALAPSGATPKDR